MKLLTICIPTFNQSKFLRRLLTQISKYNPSYPIIISDNGSVDDTYKVVKNFSKKLSNLKYFRLKKNYGFDYNYLNCVKKVKTNYLWVLGSDEQIYKDSIKIIEKYIISLNYPNGITFLDKKNDIKKISDQKAIKFDLLKHAHLLGSISLNIHKRNLYKKKNIFHLVKNFDYIQLYYSIINIIKTNNWFLVLNNKITKIEYYTIKKTEKERILNRLNQEIKGYHFNIDKLINNKTDLIKYKKLIFKKNIRPWIFQNLESGNHKKKIINILDNNSIFLNYNFEYKLIKIFIRLFPSILIKKIILIKRFLFN